MPLLLTSQFLDAETLLDRTDNSLSPFLGETLSGTPTQTPETALASASRLLLIGAPGAGKSVILHWYALTARDDQLPAPVSLPAYMRARSQEQVASLMDYLECEERRLLLASPQDASRWRGAMASGRGVLLLDDWHLLTPAEQALVAEDIQACAATLPETTRIVVARREAPAAPWAGFTAQYILPLMQGQQQEIITQWMPVAHADEHLSEEQLRQRVNDILFQMRSLSDLTGWARTPLLVNALTTVIDSMEDATPGILAGGAEALLRRVLRLLFTLATHPKYLWEKERLLLAVARLTLTEPPLKMLPISLLERAWHSVAPESGVSLAVVLDDLGQHNALLAPAHEQPGWRYIDTIFQAFYAALTLAALPPSERSEQVARHRLYTVTETTLTLLPGILDQRGRPEEADVVVATLLNGDSAGLLGTPYADPFHTALLYAAAAQGARTHVYAEGGPGPAIARRVGQILRERQDQQHWVMQMTWALVLLGPAAADALDDLIATQNILGSRSMMALRRLARAGNGQAQEVVAAYDRSHADDRPAFRLDARLEELQAGLASENSLTRMTCVMDISKFGPRAAPAMASLTALLADPDEQIRSYAAQSLGAIGPANAPALPTLLELALHDTSSGVRFQALQALQRADTFSVSPLLAVEAQLHADDPQLRVNAANAIGALGERAASLAPELIAMALHDSGYGVFIAASQAVVALGPVAIAAANAAVETTLHGDDEQAMGPALYGLMAYLGPEAAPLIETLRACIRTPDFPKRYAAITACGSLKDAAAPLLPDLRELLGEPAVAQVTLDALGEIGPAALPLRDAVLALQDDPDRSVRASVYGALWRMRASATPTVVAALLHGMDDSEYHVRSFAYTAAQSLRPMPPEVAREILRRFNTVGDEREKNDLHSALRDCLSACWDVGPLNADEKRISR